MGPTGLAGGKKLGVGEGEVRNGPDESCVAKWRQPVGGAGSVGAEGQLDKLHSPHRKVQCLGLKTCRLF